jgi:predicted RNA-binding protein (virulence factor B family)
MSFEDLLGRSATLKVRRFAPSGAYLALDGAPDRDAILLVGTEIPEGAREGDEIRVFVHRDSEGRPLATTRSPKLELGQVAFLEATACTPIGAFVDWGLAKELLVPFAEQTAPVSVGGRYAIGLYIDESGRLAGTMRVAEMLPLADKKRDWRLDEWVDGEAWRKDGEIGTFFIVEKAFVGLVPKSEPHTLARGAAARLRVSHIHPDGKIELSLRGHAHEELAGDAARVLEILSRPKAPRVGDRSTPAQIFAVFALSKKAFKRAVGRLLKEGSVSIGEDGFVRKTSNVR